jgi:hypothetical protein
MQAGTNTREIWQSFWEVFQSDGCNIQLSPDCIPFVFVKVADAKNCHRFREIFKRPANNMEQALPLWYSKPQSYLLQLGLCSLGSKCAEKPQQG